MPFNSYKSVVLFIVAFFYCSISFAQLNEHTIKLSNKNITAPANTSRWIDSLHNSGSTTPALVFIHFSTLPTPQLKQQLKDQGITLLDYIPNNTYTAFVQPSITTNNAALKQAYGIVNVLPEWKADNYVWKKVNAARGNIEVLVTFYACINKADIQQFIKAIGAQVNASPLEQYHAYKLVLSADKIRAMASWYGVQNISPVTEMVPFDLQSRPAVKGNIAVASTAYGGYALTGDSVTVGVGDNASGIYHADIKDRITNFNPATLSNHGAHVNGIVGGAGNIDPLAEGMAPHVNLLDYLYDQILPATGAMLHDHNMTITNNSYGVLLGDCGYSGTYDGYSRFLDTLTLQYPEVLHVFASGNDGWMNCTPYLLGFGTVGGGYQPAKNNVVVGSMTDYLYQAADESRGPTKDGRMKPEITAIGLGAYSTIGIDNYEWAAGTSMAAPQASGGLAVLTQRYKQLNAGSAPRGDVLKAVLLNGAMDLGNPGPDFSYGYGGMNIGRSLKILDNNNYYTNSINNADSQLVHINIPANTAQVKIMLCWNDQPASTTAATQLVNDLDLSVTAPDATVHLPLNCDPTPANVNNIATEKADHLNNVEQVTITNPSAGDHIIKVKGFNIPFPAQSYVVAYDIIPNGTQLTFPIGGEQLNNQDSIRVFWTTVATDHTFKADFSSDNGTTWTNIADNIPGTSRYCSFIPAGINSGNCLIRIQKNGTTETMTSSRFAINAQTTVQLSAIQCPGYINIHWGPVTNATSYELLSKTGKYMQVIGTTTDTTFSFSNMSISQKSYVAVRPIINGIQGYRSKALITIANNGTCTNPVSNGDLMIVKAISPVSGRMYTTTQKTTNETLTVQLRNLYFAPCNNYSVSYSMNGGAWLSMSTPLIPANGTSNASVTGIDMSLPGTYHFIVAIHNLSVTDPQPFNDTIQFTVSNLLNDTLTLPFSDDFESMGKTEVNHDSIGISPNAHWDFATQDSAGRVRSFVNEDITISGTRSISLDENQAVSSGSNNLFTGTFNLAAYDTANTEVRMDFDYILHGTPKTTGGNLVTARANDAASWLPLFTYNLNAYPGFLNKALSVSLTDAVRAEHQNFSSSLQIAFGQNDTSLIAAANYGNGITIDNVKIYTVANDAQMVSIVNPLPTNCGLSTAQPLTVQVHNGVNYTLHNVQLYYSLDGGGVFTGTIDSITAKNTVEYTFTQLLNMPAGTTHSLNVWLSQPGDTYQPNDSIINYKFRNNQIITNYPYLENFEAGNGGYYTDGINNSWQFGTPASPNINKAASGTKAWKTNLTGKYNNLEQSYLYSPCFDISGMNDPMLSFSAALDIENCGNVLCDKAYIEYTYNGVTWIKLGASGHGTNWYDSTFNAWTTNGFTRWHVASIPIPKPVGGGSVINFRFVLASDPGATFEGFAVDDIHIFDLTNGIFPANSTVVMANNISGNAWIDYLRNNQLLASVQPQNQNTGVTTLSLFEETKFSNPTATQSTMPRSYLLQAVQAPADSIGIKLYLLDSEFIKVMADTSCPSCTPATDAYTLGITQFSSSKHPANENNTLTDDSTGTFVYIPYKTIQWVPYDKGYYAAFKTKTLGEFWFNDGGPTNAFPLGIDYLNFTVYRSGITSRIYWTSFIDTAVNTYIVERSTDGINFTDILTPYTALHNNPGTYRKTDDISTFAATDLYYRLKWTITGKNTVYYSPIRKISATDSVNNIVSLHAQKINQDAVLVDWTSYIDGVADHYLLERAINNNIYSPINTTPSMHHYAQSYYYNDIPAGVNNGDIINYRLTAFFDDGSYLILPERSVEWTAPNTIGALYPNPSTDGWFTIIWYAPAGSLMQIDLLDMTGRNIFNTYLRSGSWQTISQIQTPEKAKGIYLLRTSINGQQYISKVVFE